MVSREVVERVRHNIAVMGRYDKQELQRVGGKIENIRKDWTPAQRRRMDKKLRSWK